MFFPDENQTDRNQKARAIKLRKQIEEKGIKSLEDRAISLGTPNITQNYKVLEQSNEHVVVNLQKPIKKNPTLQEFKELSGL